MIGFITALDTYAVTCPNTGKNQRSGVALVSLDSPYIRDVAPVRDSDVAHVEI
jgi:hypothetical protein